MPRHFDLKERHRHKILGCERVAVAARISTTRECVERGSEEARLIGVLADLIDPDFVEELGDVTYPTRKVVVAFTEPQRSHPGHGQTVQRNAVTTTALPTPLRVARRP